MIISGGPGFSMSGLTFAVSNSVPCAPTITSVTTGSAGSKQMTVNYTAPSFTGYPGAITGYTAISRPGCLTSSTNSTASSGSLIINGLTCGVSYQFKIYATNCQGSGVLGYCCRNNVIALPQPPQAPTIGTAVSSACTANQIIVSYTAPTCNGGGAITGYTAISTPGCYTGTNNIPGSGSIVINNVPTTTTFTFRVLATNLGGNSPYSSPSNVVGSPYIVNYLLVGGGGGGGQGVAYCRGGSGGGGGGGGVVYGSMIIPHGTTYPVVIGGGGSQNANGIPTTVLGLTAYGGGAGGGSSSKTLCYVGFSGANGGGGAGAGNIPGCFKSSSGGAGTQGYPGGRGCAYGRTNGNCRGYYGGGGGGAGGAGGPARTGTSPSGTYIGGGTGGTGVSLSISGSLAYYGGGGGGGGYSYTGASTGNVLTGSFGSSCGTGGRGARCCGWYGGYSPVANGTTSTGGGGGGGYGYVTAGPGGSGGSGIVFITYTGTTRIATGGVISTSTNVIIHKFTASGNYIA